tara:strand:+ start:695 stop:970 length:276 start_codon:yes stop_codon:yes gene_type:complete
MQISIIYDFREFFLQLRLAWENISSRRISEETRTYRLVFAESRLRQYTETVSHGNVPANSPDLSDDSQESSETPPPLIADVDKIEIISKSN